ncbi:unnamed protein product [Cuscuta campestris]|uniref:Uncharacterized protein n=1 Tax=Cuscuta campestris TaxID=132261 RepID=A0A484L3W5_9ASTE|nr:unnamed protein product [Cuscuta campestris]
MNPESSLARNSTAFATSSIVPPLPTKRLPRSPTISPTSSASTSTFPRNLRNALKSISDGMPCGEMQFTRIPCCPSSHAALLTSPKMADFDKEYGCEARPPMTAAELEEHMIVPPPPAPTMARAACLIPWTTPLRFTARRLASLSILRFMMLPQGPATPALLNMMSSLPLHSSASLTADSTSDSLETSQWMYRPPMDSASGAPRSSSMSAMMTSAPFLASSLAVSAPIPLAPPVMTATLPFTTNLRESIADRA